MKIHRDIVQGTDEWRAVRLGKVTASDAHRIVTPAKLDKSSQAEGYIAELAAERVLGVPCDDSTDGWRQRGIALEGEARDWFALTVEAVEQVGFIDHDTLAAGCSPDGIGADFGLECKCPSAKTHAGYVLRPRSLEQDYRIQVQFSLWVTGWPAWWLLSYCPGLAPVVLKVLPDRACLKAFGLWVPPLLADVDALAGMLVGPPR